MRVKKKAKEGGKGRKKEQVDPREIKRATREWKGGKEKG